MALGGLLFQRFGVVSNLVLTSM